MNGNWGQWTDVGTCTKTCGSGTVTKRRECNNPAPSNGGKQCDDTSGNAKMVETLASQACNTQACPGS